MAEPAPQMDGRKARSLRTREAIVDATLDLIQAGHLRPTAAEIAERGGLSVRSIFQHFGDLEDLFVAVVGRQVERVADLYQPLTYEGSLDRRLGDFIEHRSRLFEAVAPVRRAAELHEPFSPALGDAMRFARMVARDELLRALAPEVEASGEDPELIDALVIVSGQLVWD